MGVALALALPAVASLAALASVDARLGARAEARTSTLAPSGVSPRTRAELLAMPRASLGLELGDLRLEARYAARVWTSDVEDRPSPLLTHDAELRAATRREGTWRAELAAGAARGRTDPLADPVQAMAPADAPDATALEAVPFEALRAAARASRSFDVRTTLAGAASASRSGAIDEADQALYPVQRGASVEASLTRLASVRDTLRLRAGASGAITAAVGGDVDSASTSATAGWRRRLTPMLDGWADAGAALSWEDRPDAPVRRGVLPVGEAGLAYARDRATVELAAQVAPYVDRFTGALDPMIRARAALRWRAWSRASLEAFASGGAVPDGGSALAALDARVRYTLRERLALETGVVGRWQREQRGDLPTYFIGGVVLGVAWESGASRDAPAD